VFIAYFFGGAFLANALPHLIAGLSGKQFPTPFATPPFRGLSSPLVNVAWALVNLAAAYLLLVRTGFDLRTWQHAATAFAGFGLMSFQVARSIVKVTR
jgi:hypothetical protein